MDPKTLFQASEDSLDDLMRAVFKQLLSGRGTFEVESKKGRSTEIFGALLELKNPRARLSRSFSRAKAFSPLGELFWYLAGSDEVSFIEHYISNYGKIVKSKKKANGAYGPRLFGRNGTAKQSGGSEWDRAIRTLRCRQGSRNAVIQIFSNSDANRKRNHDKPCTCTLQFVIRKGQLLMHTHMRSNDAYLGLPHDVFSFTMLQEIAARELGVGLGPYTHSVTSLHLYHDAPATKDREACKSTSGASAYYEEGLHEYRPMPEMPAGNPWDYLPQVQNAERELRLGNLEFFVPPDTPKYWKDLTLLFQVHSIFEKIRRDKMSSSEERTHLRKVVNIMREVSPVYDLYIRDRLARKQAPVQDLLNFTAQEG